MPEKEQLSLDSLKELTEHIVEKRSEENSKETQDDNNQHTAGEFLQSPGLSSFDELKSIEELPALEEYHEFPRLGKNKTYDLDLIKKSPKGTPQRKTFLNASICSLKILLQDCELYEAYTNSGNLRPILLKNSHAIFNGLEDCDSLIFTQDEMGSFSIKVSKGSETEEMDLGCIIKFEYVRVNYSNLILSSRDIDGDIAVIGAPCPIEFTSTDAAQDQVEVATLEKKGSVRDAIVKENQIAGSFSWDLKN